MQERTIRRRIIVTENQRGFGFELDANPSTGYSWRIRRQDTQLVSFRESFFWSRPGAALGEPGIQVFWFQARREAFDRVRLTRIALEYQGPGTRKVAQRAVVYVLLVPTSQLPFGEKFHEDDDAEAFMPESEAGEHEAWWGEHQGHGQMDHHGYMPAGQVGYMPGAFGAMGQAGYMPGAFGQMGPAGHVGAGPHGAPTRMPADQTTHDVAHQLSPDDYHVHHMHPISPSTGLRHLHALHHGYDLAHAHVGGSLPHAHPELPLGTMLSYVPLRPESPLYGTVQPGYLPQHDMESPSWEQDDWDDDDVSDVSENPPGEGAD